jgi:hypothetical protein
MLIVVLHQLGAKPQPCKRGSKIMGHSCYHAGAIFVEATESFPHAVECLNQCAHFSRAARRNEGSLGGAAEMLHGRCKFGHGLGQPPCRQEGERNAEQDADDQPCCEQHARKFDRNRVDSWQRIKTAFDQQPMAILECYLNP